MGIAITSKLTRGTNNTSPFSLFEEEDARLSHSNVNTIAERDALPEWKRRSKMLVYVLEDDTYYRLGTNVTIAGQVWTEYTFGVPDNIVTEDEIFDSEGFIKADLIRNVFLNDSFVVDDEAAMLALTTVTGNFIIRTDTNSVFVKLNNDDPSEIGDFAELTYPGAVLSVNGDTGVVVINITGLIDADLAGFNSRISSSAKILELETAISDLQDQINSTIYNFVSGFTVAGTQVRVGGVVDSNTNFNSDSAGTRTFGIGASTSFNSVTIRASNTGMTNYGGLTLNSTITSLNRVSGGSSYSIQLSATGGIVEDNLSSGGLRYNADYRANYTTRSLADWGNVITQLGGKNINSNMVSPGSGQNNYVVTWNNTNQEYELRVVSSGSGTVTGTGVTGRVAIWDTTSAITSDSGLIYNNADNKLTADRFRSALAVEPSSNLTEGDLYYDTVEDDYRVYSAGEFVNISRPGYLVINPIDSPYTVQEVDRNKVIYVNTSGGDMVVELSSTTLSTNWTQTFVNVGPGTITFDPLTNTLNAVDTVCSTPYGAVTLFHTVGGEYFAIGALGSAGGGTLTDGNGTTVNGTSIDLGGLFTADVSFDVDSHQISFMNVDSFSIGVPGNALFIVGNTGGIELISTYAPLQLAPTATASLPSAVSYIGSILYDIDTDTVKYSDGIDWIELGAGGGSGVTDGDKGDIVVTGSGATWTIDDNVVDFAKFQDSVAGLSVIGRATNTGGNFAEIVASVDGNVLTLNGTSLGFGTVTTAGITNSAITYAKLQNAAGGTRIIGRSAGSAGVHAEIVATTNGQVLKRSGGILLFGNVETVAFTVATLPSASVAGQMIYVSDESGGATIAFADGTNWRRVADRNIVS